MSKFAKLKEVLVKVKDVQEMYLGIEAWDPDVPGPEVNSWVDERRPIQPPVMAGKNPKLLLSWLIKAIIHQISLRIAGGSSGLTISTISLLILTTIPTPTISKK